MESKKIELIETDNRMVVTRGLGEEDMGRCLSKGTNFKLEDKLRSGNLMYSMMIIVDYTVLYT